MSKIPKFTGEIIHCAAVRYQLSGAGTFKSTLLSVDDVVTSSLPDITMIATAARQPTILANFNQQRMYLRGKTTKINEVINISRIIVYVKPVANSYPTE